MLPLVERSTVVPYEKVRITCASLPIVSMDTVKKFYAVVLHDTLRRYAGVQFTLSLTAEGDDS